MSELVSFSESLPKSFAESLAARLQIRMPSLYELREQLPEIADASDIAIQQNRLDLETIAQSRSRCANCTGVRNCWRIGDARGRMETVGLEDEQIIIRSTECRPFADEAAHQQHMRLLREVGMTEIERGFTFRNFPVEQAKKHRALYSRALSFADDYRRGHPAKGLYIFGSTGIAKTHLVLAIMNTLLERRVRAIWIVADTLISKLRDARLKGDDEYDRLIRLYGEADVLALDEFGQSGKDFAPEALVAVLSMRAAAQRPTFFTSNLAPNETYEHIRRDVRTARLVDALRSRVAAVADAAMMIGIDHRVNSMNVLMPEGV